MKKNKPVVNFSLTVQKFYLHWNLEVFEKQKIRKMDKNKKKCVSCIFDITNRANDLPYSTISNELAYTQMH